jgi:hypothetical protein
MRDRIIIGKRDNTFYCLIGNKNEQRKEVIGTANIEKKYISDLLNVEIINFKIWDNLLVVKTNDDLVVIENYLQINHDKVFKNFNKKLSSFTVGRLSNRSLALQKKSNHKKAQVSVKVLCYATLMGVLMLPVNLDASSIFNNKINEVTRSVTQKVNQSESVKPIITEQPKVTNETVVVEKKEEVKVDSQEEYFKSKVKEYSEMYFIDYDRALQLVEQNKERIKSEYENEEVGIIRVLAEEFYSNPNISKKVIVSKMSHPEREKLLLRFASIHGIKDIDTAATILAIHRLETGNSESEACIYKNNFGGLKTKGNNGDYYVMSFKTPEIGAEAMINSFINIRNRAREKSSYNSNRSLEQNINSVYCGEASWPIKISELKREVMNDYNLGEYVSIEKPKILIR